uniref:Uncharacterized protein n=1 Tax=Ciona savignyi TaxID=51511 RepID=H2YV66_CIOSA
MIAQPGIPAVNFKLTKCRVLQNRLVEHRTCECGGLMNDSPYCKSKFPCIEVNVEYQIDGADGKTLQTSIVHSDETILNSNDADCSMAVCKSREKLNTLAVGDFLTKYGESDLRYNCYYNPYAPQSVIIKRNYTLLAIILSLLIPGLVFLTCIFFLALLCHSVRKNDTNNDLKIPANRTYLNYGVQLEDGSYSQECRASDLPGHTQRNNTRNSGENRQQSNF